MCCLSTFLRCHSLNITYLTGWGSGTAPRLSSSLWRRHLGDDRSSANTQDTYSVSSRLILIHQCLCSGGLWLWVGGQAYRERLIQTFQSVCVAVREILSGQPPSDSGRRKHPLVINNQPVKLSLSSWKADHLGRGSNGSESVLECKARWHCWDPPDYSSFSSLLLMRVVSAQ